MSSAFPPPLLSRNGYPIPWRRVVSLACNPSHIAYYAPAPSSCLRLLRRRPRRVECAVDEAALAAAQAAFRDLGDVRVLVVANGKAGQGKAAAVVEGVVVGVLREAGVAEVVVRRTERPAHAVGIAREAMAEGFDCVIAAGGDGTLKEVVTGLVLGLDERGGEILVPAVGIVPCGTGNGVAVSLGLNSPLDAALDVVHALRTRQSVAMTLLEYGKVGANEVDGPRDGVGLCGIQWGLVADVDLGTENMRWMGDLRFDVGGLAMIMKNKGKYARIRMDIFEQGQEAVDGKLVKSGGGSRRRKVMKGEVGAAGKQLVIEDRFVTVVVWNVSHQSAKTVLTPYAEVDEPCFDVMLCRENVLSRAGMLKMMTQVGEGSDKFLHSSRGAEYYKCTRISLEGDAVEGEAPTGPEGVYMTVDGERVPMEATYLKVAPESGLLRLLSAKDSRGD